MVEHRVVGGPLSQRCTELPLRPSRSPARAGAHDFGDGFAGPSEEGGLEEFFKV
ncbi:hypothetical protein GCM10009864_59670 [Streptomyces lunalinharesii]|uniref:Uncharacterized protein n=1 Tax=Streptomyces lunalinharesii TaxID=333384 RepID=A0ABN3SL06_9ACTN